MNKSASSNDTDAGTSSTTPFIAKDSPTSTTMDKSASSNDSDAGNSSTTPFVYNSKFDDEEFAPPTVDTPIFVAGDVVSPMMKYRDAPFQFTTSSMDQLAELDTLIPHPDEHSVKELASFTKQKQVTSSSLPLDVPAKNEWDSLFDSAFPSFTSFADPDNIMAILKDAMKPFECSVYDEKRWRIRVSWLCVAEEINFTISVTKMSSNDKMHEVSFRRDVGDELAFHHLVECVRARCSEVDAEPLAFVDSELGPWFDASQQLKGYRYAISDTEAAQLIMEMNAELDADTLYEVAKMVKNHCRHRGNRRLFLQTDRSGFVRALKWMLVDSEVLARFAAFILLQYAKGAREGDTIELFSSAFERNSIDLLLAELSCRESEGLCSQFTLRMLSEIQESRS